MFHLGLPVAKIASTYLYNQHYNACRSLNSAMVFTLLFSWGTATTMIPDAVYVRKGIVELRAG